LGTAGIEKPLVRLEVFKRDPEDFKRPE